MKAVAIPAKHPFVEALVAGGRALPASPASWLNQRRAAALERANALSVPTTRDEDWRFTDLAPLQRLQCQGPGAVPAVVDVAPFALPEAALRLAFVDGVYGTGAFACRRAARGRYGRHAGGRT
jgi:Fe-S cluster assembly protein SufD